MQKILIFNHFFESLHKHNREESICDFSNAVQPRRYSYSELLNRIEGLARGFIRLGANPNTRIVLFAKSSANAIIASLSVIRSGAVLVPIDIQTDDKSFVHIMNDVSPIIICTDKLLEEKFESHLECKRCQIILLEEIENYFKCQYELPELNYDKEIAIFYTSGTTAYPKGVPLTSVNVMFELEIIRNAGILTKKERVLLPLPLLNLP